MERIPCDEGPIGGVGCLPGLSTAENKELCARFDSGRLSSDGGVLVLRGIEQRLGLVHRGVRHS